ncbi:hypothetical protein BH09PSE4_BH09PSE4_22020 [soil metagenome]
MGRPTALSRTGERAKAKDMRDSPTGESPSIEGRTGQTAVIFVSTRNAEDRQGYDAAARAMDMLAAEQPGYRGIDSARGPDGTGITVSYWADEASALAWRAHAEHTVIRELGRTRWYDRYEVIVTRVTRDYGWSR